MTISLGQIIVEKIGAQQLSFRCVLASHKEALSVRPGTRATSGGLSRLRGLGIFLLGFPVFASGFLGVCPLGTIILLSFFHVFCSEPFRTHLWPTSGPYSYIFDRDKASLLKDVSLG